MLAGFGSFRWGLKQMSQCRVKALFQSRYSAEDVLSLVIPRKVKEARANSHEGLLVICYGTGTFIMRREEKLCLKEGSRKSGWTQFCRFQPPLEDAY